MVKNIWCKFGFHEWIYKEQITFLFFVKTFGLKECVKCGVIKTSTLRDK